MSAGGTASDPDLLPGLLDPLMRITAGYRAKVPVHRLQVRYIRIDRDRDNRPSFTASDYKADDGGCFYPASTVKLPLALAALEKLNRLDIGGLDKYTTMTTVPEGCSTATTVAECIEKIFLVSDNAAANHLYDFVGRDLDPILGERGYVGTHILHRFGLPWPQTDSGRTPALFFHRQGRVIYRQPEALHDGLIPPTADTLQECGPDLSGRNRTTLTDLLDMVRSVMFPDTCSRQQRFQLSTGDHTFLQGCMSRLPGESLHPAYDTDVFPPSCVKFLLAGGSEGSMPAGVRIFNKCGWALGFLTDTAYIRDFKNHVEFMLAATLKVGSDEEEGEEHYRYREGRLLLGTLGQFILGHELKRPGKYLPDLSRYSSS